METGKRSGLNVLTSLAYQVILLVSGFLVPKILLGAYGSEVNGLVSSLTQLIGYIAIVEAGLGGAAIYALYQPLSDSDYSLINRIVSTTKALYIQVGNIFSVLLLLLAIIYPLFINIHNISFWEMALLIVALGMRSIFDFYSLAKYRTLLTADNRLYIIQISLILYQILNTAIIVFLSLNNVSVLLVYWAALLPIFARTLFLNLYVKRRYTFLDTSLSSEPKLMSDRWNVLFLNLVQSAQGAGPTLIATAVLGLVSVSIYSVYNVVFSGIVMLLTMITNSLQATFGQKIVNNKRLANITFLKFDYFFGQAVAAISAISVVMIIPFIKLYIGTSHESGYYDTILGTLMGINLLFFAGKAPTGMLVMAAGHYKQTRIQSAIQATVLLIAGFLFSIQWGLYGLIIGMILSNFYRWVDLTWYVPKKIFETDLKKQVKHSGLMLFTFIASLSLFLKLDAQTNATDWVAWFTLGIKNLFLSIMVSFFVTVVTERKYVQKLFLLRK
ncbi:lipopolysaccharide biosynthesis protein [Weissella confusa]|uniref:lipopolysaccharide biosynthesis protein n=1 Tax=Weissella confusa TaxID=1583 RepID=UPI00223B9576|nr:hypothetical protein [Weissella confusa]